MMHLRRLQSFIDDGRVVDFDDHYYPPAMAAGGQYEVDACKVRYPKISQRIKSCSSLILYINNPFPTNKGCIRAGGIPLPFILEQDGVHDGMVEKVDHLSTDDHSGSVALFLLPYLACTARDIP